MSQQHNTRQLKAQIIQAILKLWDTKPEIIKMVDGSKPTKSFLNQNSYAVLYSFYYNNL